MLRELPRVESYGTPHKTKHYGNLDTLKVTIPEVITLFYSYQTIIAYRDVEDGFVMSQNIWGSLTGGHMNLLSGDKKLRIPHEEFEIKLQAAMERHCQ
jgi:hypothetical protein